MSNKPKPLGLNSMPFHRVKDLRESFRPVYKGDFSVPAAEKFGSGAEILQRAGYFSSGCSSSAVGGYVAGTDGEIGRI